MLFVYLNIYTLYKVFKFQFFYIIHAIDNTVGDTIDNTVGDTIDNTVGDTIDNTVGDTIDNTVGDTINKYNLFLKIIKNKKII